MNYGIILDKRAAEKGEPEILGEMGEGDSKIVLLEFPDGVRAFATNADPVFEGDHGFAEAEEKILSQRK